MRRNLCKPLWISLMSQQQRRTILRSFFGCFIIVVKRMPLQLPLDVWRQICAMFSVTDRSWMCGVSREWRCINQRYVRSYRDCFPCTLVSSFVRDEKRETTPLPHRPRRSARRILQSPTFSWPPATRRSRYPCMLQ